MNTIQETTTQTINGAELPDMLVETKIHLPQVRVGNQDGKTTQTMSSLEIAELTGKRHNNVMQDIRDVLAEVGIQSAAFSVDYKDSKNRTYPCFNLPRRECDLIIAGYSAKYRLAIIDRWQELEQQVATPLAVIPQSTKQEVSMDLLLNRLALSNDKVILSNMKVAQARAKLNQTLAVIEAKTYKLLAQGAKLKEDLQASKSVLPRDSITHLLDQVGSDIKPKDANTALIGLGYLHTDRRTVTNSGTFYGRSNRSANGNATIALWFNDEFENLYQQILEYNEVG